MSNQKIKKILKIATVALIISSMIGCSSLPKTAYTYKEELKEYKSTDILPEGVLQTKGEDGSTIDMIVNKQHKIKLISKNSPSYNDIEECKSNLEEDYKKVEESLHSDGGKFSIDKSIQKEYSYSSNKEFKIVIKNCYKEVEKYKYNIQISPKDPNKDISKKITNVILKTFGILLASPFILIGAAFMLVLSVIVITPLYVYFVITGTKSF